MEFDLLLLNARIADVFRCRLFEGWLGIRGGRFVAVEAGAAPSGLSAAESRDLAGRIVMPGLIDAHLHIGVQLVDAAPLCRSGAAPGHDGPSSATRMKSAMSPARRAWNG